MTTADLEAMTDSELLAAHRAATARKIWQGPVGTIAIEREMHNRRPVELAQDAYYYGTAADVRSAR